MSAETIRELRSTLEAEHGTRARYVLGCRCKDCRASNVALYHARMARAREAVAHLPVVPGSICPGWEGVPCPKQTKLRRDSAAICSECLMRPIWNGLVDAKPAREHMKALGKKGVGYRQIADAAKVCTTIVRQVMTGEKKRVRKSTLEAILSVDEGARADHALIPAGDTKRILRELAPEFLTKRQLAAALGYRGYGLPTGKRITVWNAERIRRFKERVAPEAGDE